LPISKNKFIFSSPKETQSWAKKWAATLNVGDVLALIGPLGAGKTTLVQGLAAGWKTRACVASPTFALVNEYPSSRGPLYHMDMYRLSPKEIKFFPLEDYLGTGLCVIEWADRIVERLPKSTRALRLSIQGEHSRLLTIGRL